MSNTPFRDPHPWGLSSLVFRSASALTLCLAAVALTACEGGEQRYDITETRTLDQPRPGHSASGGMRRTAPTGPADSFSRFDASRGAAGAAGAPPAAKLSWTLPSGWKQLAPRQFRDGNFAVESRPAVESFLTVLAGDGGGLAANLNRWRGQMGAAPLDEAAITALPRTQVLGGEAVLIEIPGSGGATGKKLAAMALMRPGKAIFGKLTGPAADVDAELANFHALCRSLTESAPTGHAPTARVDPNKIGWTAPDGWAQGPAKSMRVVTYAPKDHPAAQCYITVLPGQGGGTAANLDRWRRQMGQGPLSADDFAKLPTVKVLGRDAPWIEVGGDFRGEGAATQQGGQGLLGLICELGDFSVFVKMTGPAAVTSRERDNFLAFCRSLKADGGGSR